MDPEVMSYYCLEMESRDSRALQETGHMSEIVQVPVAEEQTS